MDIIIPMVDMGGSITWDTAMEGIEWVAMAWAATAWVAMGCSLTTQESNSITPHMGLTEAGTFMETMQTTTTEVITHMEDKCMGTIMVWDHIVVTTCTTEVMDMDREVDTEEARASL